MWTVVAHGQRLLRVVIIGVDEVSQDLENAPFVRRRP
jgi:hypothetical protein